MIWLIAKKDFLLNLLSVRFVIGFLLCLFVIPFTLIVSTDNYLNRVRIFKIEQERADNQLKDTRVYSGVRPTIVESPKPLSVFSDGISENIGNKVKINFGEYPLFPEGHVSTRDNPFLNAFFSIDFSKVIAILISLLALVFAYDAITRERENGTMKLIFTGKIGRITFLSGKLVGLIITLLPILLFCYLLALLILFVHPQISMNSADWTGIGILFFSSIIYMFVFILLGVFLSCVVARSSTAIVLSLLCWVWFLFLMPNIATYLAQSFVKLPLYENVQAEMNEYYEKYFEEFYKKSTEITDKFSRGGLSYYNCNMGSDGYIEMSGGYKETAEYQHQMNRWSEPVRIDYADKMWVIQKNYLDRLIQQQKVQQQLSWLSPSEIFGQTADILCGTDIYGFLNHMENVRNYRQQVILYFVNNKLFDSYRYFTIQPKDEFVGRQEWADIEAGRLQSNLSYGWHAKTKPVLDLDGFPVYNPPVDAVEKRIQGALGRIAGLAAIGLILLIGSIVLFMRYELK
jgi:ABC-type transport system involved in multi-copper enzyme maturation, permease component